VLIMKALVVFHGDCDGVIAAGLYIRRFLMDYYPKNIVLKFTQPWRIVRDLDNALRSISRSDLDTVVILDLALNEDLLNYIERELKNVPITVIDHHTSSHTILERARRNPLIKLFWEHTISTPAVMTNMIKDLNPYEQFLVNVANVCEGGECSNMDVKQAADRIKLSLALDPTDSQTFYNAVHKIVEGVELWKLPEIETKYRRGKWLLNVLVHNIDRRSVEVCGWRIASFTAAESLIYAGLFGIASSEYSKRMRKPVVLIRSEETKIVVTIRSPQGKALELCKRIASVIGASFYGGHREAASLTLYSASSIEEVEKVIKEVVKDFSGCS